MNVDGCIISTKNFILISISEKADMMKKRSH
jgi:hypothetical protein